MTKEELLRKYCDMPANSNVKSESIYFDLLQFFSQTVIIPKGTNRHPYADVLHYTIENGNLQKRYQIGDVSKQLKTKWTDFKLGENDEFRIKPQELVYEWQWMYKFKNGNEFLFTTYQTEEENAHFMSTIDKNSLGESSKKLKKQSEYANNLSYH